MSEENGLKTVNDEGALRKVIEEIVANNPKSVEDYIAGKKKAMGFFVGQTMRAMKGRSRKGSGAVRRNRGCCHIC